jgi:glycosyltransferase involved in cell wall biosynthesis
MKFTFITSFYKTYNNIDAQYDSIKNQTYGNWEWIITDDFSDDGSREKLIDIASKDRKVKFVEQSKKKEMFYNPHWFCEDAEYIVELGSDDLLSPKTLEIYSHFLTKFPDVIMISSRANSFNEDGGWNNFEVRDFKDCKNMLCGNILYLKCWRNILKGFDFNPGDWMDYYYNDLVFNTHLEEHGKVLVLPRSLYYYNYRMDSFSRSEYNFEEYEKMLNENKHIIEMVKNRRNEDLDTVVRYFEPIDDIVKICMDHDFSFEKEQQRVSLLTTTITENKFNLIKELLFDHDIVLNKIDNNFDYIFYYIKSPSDIIYLKNTFSDVINLNSKLKIVIDLGDYDSESQSKYYNSVIDYLNSNIEYTIKCFKFCIISVIK